MSIVIPLNKFIKNHPLNLKIKIKNGLLTAGILIPKNYPNTPLIQAFNKYDEYPVKRGYFGHLSIDINYGKSYPVCYHPSYTPWKDDDDSTVGFLHEFYIYSNLELYIKKASKDEKKTFRGIGKLMLCIIMKYMYSKNLVDIQNYYLIAEADGGDPNPRNVEKYKKSTMDELILLLYKKYPYALTKYIYESKNYIFGERESDSIFGTQEDNETDESIESLAIYISTLEENIKLIEYYNKNLGMKMAQPGPSLAALVAGKGTVLFKYCDININENIQFTETTDSDSSSDESDESDESDDDSDDNSDDNSDIPELESVESD